MTRFSKDINFSFNSGYIMAPICLKKLQVDVFLNWNRRVSNFQSKINYTSPYYFILIFSGLTALDIIQESKPYTVKTLV